jgi:thiosulfate/3-mercaptopyruvate sulfurtransferase
MRNHGILMIGFSVFLSGCGGGAPSKPAAETPASTESAATGVAADETLPPVPPEPAPAQEQLGLLISVEQLQGRLDADPPRIVDVRLADQYAEAHVPGAVSVDLADWKSVSLSPDGLNDGNNWTERVGGLGITRDTEVVVYGENPTDAARVWWILKYLGVGQVAMLDGGWTAWQASGAATDDVTPDVEAVAFVPEFQTERLVQIQELAANREAAAIIDTRSDAEYDGTGGPGQRHGHIPGAVHIEWKDFMTDDGRFRTAEEIQALLHERGIEPGGEQVVHCQSGGRASVAALALELAGYGPARNYYCGWSEWGASEETPVVTESAAE